MATPAGRQRSATNTTGANTNAANLHGMALGTLAVPRPTARPPVRVLLAAGPEFSPAALTRVLGKSSPVEVVGIESTVPFDANAMAGKGADILLLASCGNAMTDMSVVRQARATQPGVEIVMLGEACEEGDFLQLVRAGVRGYISPDAGAEQILQAIVEVRGGAAVCPGKLCAGLFRYFEREAKSLPSASIHQRLGLTRREQQLIPLVAKGLTNKEIANHFSLSEQTVKNHLYRMKHKIGAEDRLSIVHLCRMQGFMV
jgi:DNA-binding NarL/FixJ family response regulator